MSNMLQMLLTLELTEKMYFLQCIKKLYSLEKVLAVQHFLKVALSFLNWTFLIN